MAASIQSETPELGLNTVLEVNQPNIKHSCNIQ